MENFVVSARKYRPDTFKSVVGQQALTTTLKNAIVSGRLAHAYLFCGPRGVGKTTCARIFAKTINCMNPTADHEACNECESCRSFNEQRSMNIHELDAASNNSVDDIRNLIAQVRIPPQIGKYSVFIIDEVHMLSSAAFNAFLKTLEEPPAHAIFILATTEKHKILPTILSRCQIYDFTRITLRDIISHLKYVAENEGVSVDEQTLEIVAQKADGGMRDALSIFDQLVSFSGKTISHETAITNLNVLDTVHYFNMVNYALSCDVNNALLLYDDILTRGFDPQNFIGGLGSHLRNLLVSKSPDAIRLLESSEATMEQYKEQALRCHSKFIFKALQIVSDAMQQYRITSNKRLCVEMMLIKLCQILQGDPGPEPQNKVKSILSSSQPATNVQVQQAAPTAKQQTQAAAVQNNVAEPPSVVSQGSDAQAQQTNVPQAPKQTPVEHRSAKVSPTNTANTASPPTGFEFVSPIGIAHNDTPAPVNETQHPSATQKKSYGTMAYTDQMIIDAWKEFTNQNPTQDTRFASIFATLLPQRTEDADKWCVFLYPHQKQIIEDKIEEINDFVRKSVSNDNVEIKIVVAQGDNDVSFKPYLPQDKLDQMISDNPNLVTLINNFNLKLD